MTASLRVGEVLSGKYRLEEHLGSGGMGDVYRATNVDIGRTVAIKTLREEHAQNEHLVDRFMREARAANLVRHPNVVDVLDIGRDERGTPFIVQELLIGEDLARYVQRKGGKLPFDEVATLLCPVIDAIAEAHARDVVHRDIKPENVFLTTGAGKQPVAKLLDFGISKVRTAGVRATEVGVMMGTPAYMPPEQVQGARDADPRSDVWALGVMLFELLSGRLPFDDDTAPALFFAIATKDAPLLADVLPDISWDVSRVVERCLRRVPSERYPTAAELARDLRHLLDGTDLEATQTRSIRPAALHAVPDLAIPDLPGVPTRVGPNGPPSAVLAHKPADSSRDKKTLQGGKRVALTPPGPPDLVVTPSAPALPVQKPATARAPEIADAPPPQARAPEPNAPPASAPMAGVMLSPGGAAPRSVNRPPAGRDLPPPIPERETSLGVSADISAIVGLAAVGLVAILSVGVLMQTVHRPDGWPLVRFLIGPGSSLNTPVQGALCLLALAIAGTYTRNGHRHWRGDLGGGRSSAVIHAVIAGALAFAAVELGTAAF